MLLGTSAPFSSFPIHTTSLCYTAPYAHDAPRRDHSLLPTRVCAVPSAPHSTVCIVISHSSGTCPLRIPLSNSQLCIVLVLPLSPSFRRLALLNAPISLRLHLCASCKVLYALGTSVRLPAGQTKCARNLCTLYALSPPFSASGVVRRHTYGTYRGVRYFRTSADLPADDVTESKLYPYIISLKT